MLMVGSGVITVRAEKSTRFPIKFPLIRPSLALSLLHMDFIGLPDLCVACEIKVLEIMIPYFQTQIFTLLCFRQIINSMVQTTIPLANQVTRCRSTWRYETATVVRTLI